MQENRKLFFQYLAQTSPKPIGIEMVRADGIYLYDAAGKAYIDGISGFSVNNIGHNNEQVKQAIKNQVDKYMHLIVYGEFIQQPQVQYAQLLCSQLPQQFNNVYFTNSGAEAVEAAMKLAKRVTGKPNIICFNNAYHGSTQGALSLIGDEYWRSAYRPLLPGIVRYTFNDETVFKHINESSALVLVEVCQAEAGVIKVNEKWLTQLRNVCTQTCTLLAFDEIQTGFGRTGQLFAFQHYNIHPDILILGKALGGGMPLGAIIANHDLMKQFTNNPVLGHITTFGGHPVSCAAGMASLQFLLQNQIVQSITEKEKFLTTHLQHSLIKRLNIQGLFASMQLESFEQVQLAAHQMIKNGLITDWFLFASDCIRIAPPLTITLQELKQLCDIVITSLDELR